MTNLGYIFFFLLGVAKGLCIGFAWGRHPYQKKGILKNDHHNADM